MRPGDKVKLGNHKQILEVGEGDLTVVRLHDDHITVRDENGNEWFIREDLIKEVDGEVE